MGNKGRWMDEHGRKPKLLQPRLSLLSPGPSLFLSLLCLWILVIYLSNPYPRSHSYDLWMEILTVACKPLKHILMHSP